MELVKTTQSDVSLQLGTTYYDLVILALAECAYQYENKVHNEDERLAAITSLVESLPQIPSPTDSTTLLAGYWKMEWIAQTDDNSNLLYLTSYRTGARPSGSATDGTPYFFAVGIRGTDVMSDDIGDFLQLLQDMNAVTLKDWAEALGEAPNPYKRKKPELTSMGSIATGTKGAFQDISSVKDKALKKTIGEVLLDLSPTVPVMVTGHSLGGTLTQVMASYLAWQLDDATTSPSTSVIPSAMAPATAGNQSFMNGSYELVFPTGRYWTNHLDLVPQAFWNLKYARQNLWTSYTWPNDAGYNVDGQPGPDLPEVLAKAILLLNGEVELLNYTRPSDDFGFHLLNETGMMPTGAEVITDLGLDSTADPTTGLHVLMWQHFPTAYHKFMSQESGLAAYELPAITT